MATLHQLEPRHRPSISAAFTRGELSLLLSVYSRRVAGGEWRDYAIDNCDGTAVFSIFRRSWEPALFAVVKQADRDYALFHGQERVDSNRSLPDLLASLEARPRLVQG